MMNTRHAGRKGEDAAVRYLLEHGYRIISRNYQCQRGEIDCIAESPEGDLVFIEVKAGSGRSCGHPFQWIRPGKQRQIVALARRYLAEHNIVSRSCRFDVIAVLGEKVEHLRNAFLAA